MYIVPPINSMTLSLTTVTKLLQTVLMDAYHINLNSSLPVLLVNGKLERLFYYCMICLCLASIPCQESSVTVHIAGSSIENSIFTIFYAVRYCQNNEYSTLCRNGITDEEAESICLQQGRAS